MKTLIFVTLMSISAYCGDYGDLKKEDQPYYKNEAFDGMNKLERIDSLVKEVNVLYGKVELMKKEMETMKEEIKQLKSAQK